MADKRKKEEKLKLKTSFNENNRKKSYKNQ